MADEVVGSAYVVIRALTNRIRDDIKDGVKRGASQSRSELEAAGESMGETIGKSAGEKTSEGIRKQLRDDKGRFKSAGSAVGDQLSDGFRRGGWFRRISKNVVGAFRGGGGSILDTARGFGESMGRSLSEGMSSITGGLKGLIIPVLLALIPLVTSAISAMSGSLVAFIGSAAQASYASFALVGVLGTLIQTKSTLKLVTGGLAEALKGEEGAMAKLAPSAQNVVKALKELTPAWAGLKKQVQGAALVGVGPMLEKLGETTLPTLQKGLVGTGTVLNGIVLAVGRFAQTESFVTRFGQALKGNNRILEILGKAAVPILNGILNVYVALLPAARRLARAIADNAKQFSDWSESGKAMDGLMEKFNRGWLAATRLWKIAKNLGSVLKNVFGAAVGPGDGLLKTLVRLTAKLRDFTDLTSTKSSIAEWAQKGIKVTGQLFKALGRGFKAISGLFNPDILGGFLTVLEKMMPTLTTIVGVFQDALAPILEKIGKSLEENGPKFAKLFEALAPLLKGIGSVIGELISQSLDLLGTIASVITPVVAAISNFIGPILTKFAPIIATVILAFTTWGGALVKLVPIIGKFLAPLVNLTSWLLKKVAPAFKLVSNVVVGVFKLWFRVVSTTIGFISRIIGTVFGWIGKYVPQVAKNIWGSITTAFNGIKSTVGGVISSVWKLISGGFNRIVDFLGGLPGKLLNLAVAFLNAGTALGGKIIDGLKAGVMGAAGLITDIAGNVWDAVKGFLNSAISKINAALEFTIDIPGPNITINPPNIPQLATGGRAARGGTLAVIGEGKEAETVLPDSLLRGLIERANETGQAQAQERLAEQNTQPGMLVQIERIEAHDYEDFMRQLQRRTRLQALGGRRVATGGAA